MIDTFQDIWEIRRIDPASNPALRASQPVAERYIWGAAAAQRYAENLSSLSGIPHKAWQCTQSPSGRILHRAPVEA